MDRAKPKKGKVVIISGPSGVGKSTICKELMKRLDNACLSVSVTTRPKSQIEVEGLDYWFVSRKEFEDRIAKGQFLEYAEVFGNLYGTPRDKVDEAMAAGRTVILEIDVQGGRQVKAKYPDAVMVFVLPPSRKKLAERLHGRGRDDAKAAVKRLDGAGSEIAAARQYYEHKVINDDLRQAVDEVIKIVKSDGTHSNS
jgi:guanylate kinase